jgi:hypothetical protein
MPAPFRTLGAASTRFPWLVFPLLPLPAVIAGFFLPVLLVMGLARLCGCGTEASAVAAPVWFRLPAAALLFTAKFAMMPLTMLLLSVLVWRQRLSMLWLLPGLLILLPLVTDVVGDFPTAAEMLQHRKTDFHVGIGWNWIWSTGGGGSLLPGRLGKELQSGIYWGLARQLLILASPAVLLALRLRQRKDTTHAV